jgi:hypothetical protein
MMPMPPPLGTRPQHHVRAVRAHSSHGLQRCRAFGRKEELVSAANDEHRAKGVLDRGEPPTDT